MGSVLSQNKKPDSVTREVQSLDQETHDSIVEELTKRWKEDFVTLYNKWEQDKIHAEDNMFIGQGMETLKGKAAFKACLAAISPMTVEDVDIVEVQPITADWAYTISGMELSGAYGPLKVRSFTVWRKIKGEWLMYRDMFNTADSAPAAVADSEAPTRTEEK